MTYQITSEAELRHHLGGPIHELVVAKSTDVLNASMRRYIELSPFAALATHGTDGASDVSPRGDAPGWVHIKDDKTLIVPERPGNKRLDSVINIINQRKLSLLFMIPGVLETVRINGSGSISMDPGLLALFPVNGKLPELCIVVTIDEALGHCSKAYRRSKLWEDAYKPTVPVPSLAELMSDHLDLNADLAKELDAGIKADVAERMY
jgi:PPOX class probable FMN-dependent enzyme